MCDEGWEEDYAAKSYGKWKQKHSNIERTHTY